MAKDRAIMEPTKKPSPSHSGKVCGVRATASEFKFDLEGKKGKLHTLTVDCKASHLTQLVIAAYASGKKLHVTVSGEETASELRFGDIPKTKPKKILPVTIAKAAADGAAVSAPAPAK